MDENIKININKENYIKEGEDKKENITIENIQKNTKNKDKIINNKNNEINGPITENNTKKEKTVLEKENINKEKENIIKEKDQFMQNKSDIKSNVSNNIIIGAQIDNKKEMEAIKENKKYNKIEKIKKENKTQKETTNINKNEINNYNIINNEIKNNKNYENNEIDEKKLLGKNNNLINENQIQNNNKEKVEKNKSTQKKDNYNKETIQKNIIDEKVILKVNKSEENNNKNNENIILKINKNDKKIPQKDLKENIIENEILLNENEINKNDEKILIKHNKSNIKKENLQLDNINEIKETSSEKINNKQNKEEKNKNIIENNANNIDPKENNNLNMTTKNKKLIVRKLTPTEKPKINDTLNVNKKQKEKVKSVKKIEKTNKIIEKNLNNINPIILTNIETNSNLNSSQKEQNNPPNLNNNINIIKNEPNNISKSKNLLIKSVQPNNLQQIKELFKSGQINEEQFNPNDFNYISIIGEGEFGKIFLAQKKNDNQYYAIKLEIFKKIEYVKRSQMITKIIKDFLKKTNSEGVIKIYGDICLQQNNLYNYYVLMEQAERDMEQELTIRCNTNQFYSETDIINVLCQLILTLSEMQKNHIAHRDIKPQNILIIKGRYKISDFGEALVFENNEDSGELVQNICGTELYMSPIVFFGMRNKCVQIKHNAYKSDVFSLGLCILLGATLNYDSLCQIREVTDMNVIRNVLIYYLSGRFSNSFISFLFKMLEVDERKRPDFIQLENMLVRRK